MKVVSERRAWTTAALRERCQRIRQSLVGRGDGEGVRALIEEITAYWPGGPENPEKGHGGWIYCYATLIGLLRVREAQARPEHGQVERAVADALASTPRAVAFADGTTHHVFPKSYHTLEFLDWLDRQLVDAGSAALAASTEESNRNETRVFALAPLIRSLAVRLWLWILTHEGPGLPFSEESPADPPAWTLACAPGDLLSVAEAHVQVNAVRLEIIARAFPPDPKHTETRLSLAGFLGTMANEMGVRPFELTRRWSLGELFAQSVTAAQASREAKAEAEAKSAASRN